MGIFQSILELFGPEDVNAFDNNLNTPLRVLLAGRQRTSKEQDMVEALLRAGASPHLRPSDELFRTLYPEDQEMHRWAEMTFNTPFQMAIRNQWYNCVLLMLNLGDNALLQTDPVYQSTCLHLAVGLPNPLIFNLLCLKLFPVAGKE
ncbi:hypothetical protein V8F20_002448 [Naviculisporaceae sp. PSN 640]